MGLGIADPSCSAASRAPELFVVHRLEIEGRGASTRRAGTRGAARPHADADRRPNSRVRLEAHPWIARAPARLAPDARSSRASRNTRRSSVAEALGETPVW